MESYARLVILLQLVKVAAREEDVWKVLNVCLRVFPEVWILHPLRLDEHHAET